MEALLTDETIKLLITEYGAWAVVAIVLFIILKWIGKFINKVVDKFLSDFNGKHDEAILKLDKVVDGIAKLDKNIENHTVQLEFGAKEMARIDEHNKMQDVQISDNSKELHRMKGSSLKIEHIKDIVKAVQ